MRPGYRQDRNPVTWRERARPLVVAIWRQVAEKPSRDQRRAFREGYPWGERAMWPYKVWRSEVRRVLGLTIDKRSVAWLMRKREAEGQLRLFTEE